MRFKTMGLVAVGLLIAASVAAILLRSDDASAVVCQLSGLTTECNPSDVTLYFGASGGNDCPPWTFTVERRNACGSGDWALLDSNASSPFVDTPGSGTWQYRVTIKCEDCQLKQSLLSDCCTL
jgi:hypothetical protein